MPNLLSEIENLKIIYKEIIEGFTVFEEFDIFVKHLTDLENAEVLRKKLFFFEKFQKEGLPSEDDKLKQLIESEQWSKSQEEEILQYRYIISDNEKNVKKLIPQQHAPILKVISETKKSLNKLLAERQNLIGRTANEFAERDSFHYFIYLSLFKDKTFQNRVFEHFKDFDGLEDDEIKPYISFVEETLKKFSEENIRKISVLPFFINIFAYSKERLYTFLGKPIVYLTPYQTLLLSLGSRNLTVLTQSETEPPELLSDVKIEDLIKWYDSQYSVLFTKSRASK